MNYDYQLVVRIPAYILERITNDAQTQGVKKTQIARDILLAHYQKGPDEDG